MQARTLRGMRGVVLALSCSLLGPLATAQETPTIVTVEGANFDTQIDIGGRSLELLGSGLFEHMLWDAYVGAYYQASGFPRPAPLGDVPRHLVLEYLHAIEAEELAATTHEGVARNIDERRLAALSDELRALVANYRDAAPGDRYALTWTGDELRLSLNDEVLYRSDNQALAAALFAIWLGDEPAQEAFKQALLGKARQ